MPTATSTETPPRHRSDPSSARPWLVPLLRRLHFYAGIIVGPFILIAALTGALYAMSTPIEKLIYSEQLTAPVTTQTISLADQVEAASAHTGIEAMPSAVRPAPEPGATTRVMYADEDLAASESRAIFVDPGTGEIRGDLTVYGTSGALPVRTWIDQFHRSLHLGDIGRLYSEFAASWMSVVAVAGIGLWIHRARLARTRREVLAPRKGTRGHRRTLSVHAPLGIVLATAMLFLSVTGITWSQYGGANVTELRERLGWTSPAVATQIGAGSSGASGEHAGHEEGMDMSGVEAGPADPALFDEVLAVGHEESIDVGLVEILPAQDGSSAWVVQEIQRSYPTEVDVVSVDPATLQVVDRVDWEEHGLMAKLARWGIDIHMGSMFGLANQIGMALIALGIASLVVMGYAMWWQRRPTRGGTAPVGRAPARGALRAAPWWGLVALGVVAVGVGVFLPMIGVGLIIFLVIDQVLAWRSRTRPGASTGRRRAV